MRVAVTGSSGFLGQLVLRVLDNDPKVASILGLDIVPGAFSSPKFSHQVADVREADFRGLLAGHDAVIHLAFIVEPPRGLSMADIDAINVEGSARVFAAAIDAGVATIVYASSIASYGTHADNPEDLDETWPLRPNEDWYYSRTKGQVEVLLDEIQGRSPETVVVRLRPGVFLGPTATNLMAQMLSRRLVFTSDNSRFNLCWDQDVADAFGLALHHGESDIFNLTGGPAMTMAGHARLLSHLSIRIPAFLLVPVMWLGRLVGVLNKGHQEWFEAVARGEIIASSQRAREGLGWRPRFDAQQALFKFAGRDPEKAGKPTEVR